MARTKMTMVVIRTYKNNMICNDYDKNKNDNGNVPTIL